MFESSFLKTWSNSRRGFAFLCVVDKDASPAILADTATEACLQIQIKNELGHLLKKKNKVCFTSYSDISAVLRISEYLA